MIPDDWCTAEVHGARHYRYYGCRCQVARDREAAEQIRRRREGIPQIVDGTGTARRLRALVRAGWTQRELGVQLFVTQKMVHCWTLGNPVHRTTAAKVADLYDRIGLEEGTSAISRHRATAAGWPSPIEWGDDIDDPKAKPLNLDKPARKGGWGGAPMSDIEMLAETGANWTSAAIRLGVDRKALERRAYRADRRDLVAKFSRNSEGEHAGRVYRNQWSA